MGRLSANSGPTALKGQLGSGRLAFRVLLSHGQATDPDSADLHFRRTCNLLVWDKVDVRYLTRSPEVNMSALVNPMKM
jgi:hypothetical protein